MPEQCASELEELMIGEISIKEKIKYLKPEIIDTIQETYGDIDTYVQNFKNQEAVDDIMDCLIELNMREQKVIMLRFCLLDGEIKTAEEIARIMETTRERVRQIECKCFRKVWGHCRRRKKLKDFLDS